MREIKFRAWDKILKNMAEVDSILFNFTDNASCYDGEPVKYNVTKEDVAGLSAHIGSLTERFILMQYTGLKDKDGKEIYEGDILKIGDKFGEVLYDEQQSAFIILFYPHNKNKKSGCVYLPSTWPSPIKEVMGNIYENPALKNKQTKL